ncbi:CapA family protein [Thiobacillus sp.]|uniref:CapA family protein n=1 Tax=Thiobacillus sp. TaxID=924 RepID=UPI0025EB1236|nr:CapA family protein [Thiobacillus sp.]MBT9540238.1 CapA family protein [Thiobacillus sp.]
MLSLALIGDVMLGRGVDAALKYMQPADMWGDVLPHLLQADLRIANLECALTRHAQPWTRSWKMFHFRADPGAVRFLQAARIDICSLANNHVLDFEARGLRDTLRTLDTAGIRHAGAGLDSAAAAAPALVEVHGVSPCRVALLAFTDNQPDFAASAQQPGTQYLEVSLHADTLARVADAITRARDMGADLVVFSNHWGANFVERPAVEFRRFAHRVIELGADVYYGHSAHICQGIEIHQGKPILYDTGNFIDDYAVDPVLRNDRSCLFRLLFDQGRLQCIELIPVRLTVAKVRLARGEDFAAIATRMEGLCAELGTPLEHQADRLVYTHPPGAQ